MSASRIYLDNAATSFPKPPEVASAMDRYQRELGTAIGRGSTRIGSEVQRVVDRCRLDCARFFGAARAEQVIFTLNGTDSLNLAILGLLRENERAISTAWDHNSVLRPLQALRQQRGVSSVLIPATAADVVDLDAFEQELKTPTRLVILTHASNVTGNLLPVAEMSQMAHTAGALVLLDAAQTAGYLPVHFEKLGVDLIACPGHKGLLGPLGTGLLILAPGVEDELEPSRYGGTGTHSESDWQPNALPEKFESGNLNAPGLFGLAAAMDWQKSSQKSQGELAVTAGSSARQSVLADQLVAGLRELPHVQLHGTFENADRVGLVSFSLPQIAPQVMATLLDEHFGIESRAGLHCAPRAHETLGTLQQGGTVRLSLGHFTTKDDIDATLEALAQIVVAM